MLLWTTNHNTKRLFFFLHENSKLVKRNSRYYLGHCLLYSSSFFASLVIFIFSQSLKLFEVFLCFFFLLRLISFSYKHFHAQHMKSCFVFSVFLCNPPGYCAVVCHVFVYPLRLLFVLRSSFTVMGSRKCLTVLKLLTVQVQKHKYLLLMQ